MKLTLFILLVANTVLMVLQGYEFLINFSATYFISYSPYWFGSFFIILSLATSLIMSDYASNALKSIQLWELENARPETGREIKFEVQVITVYICVNIVVSLIAGFAHAFPSKNAEEICYVYKIIEIYVPKYKNELCWMYKCSYFIYSLTMPASCNQVVYISTHMRFQIYLMLDLLKSCLQDGDEIKTELPYNDNFQKETRKKMVNFIKRHETISRCGLEMNGKVSIYIMLFAVVGGVLGISILMFYFKFTSTLVLSDYLHAGTVAVAAVVTFVGVISAGQKIEDLTRDVSNAWFTMPWYLLNKVNQKLYLTFMITHVKHFSLRFTDNMSLNYNLGVAIGKMIYSMLSVLAQMSDKDTMS